MADAFCRDVTTVGLTLVDWDGYLANPAITFTLVPPARATFPLTVSVTTDEPRIYFDRSARPHVPIGTPYPPPAAEYTFTSAAPAVFRIAIWPDRDGEDEEHALQIVGGNVTTRVPVHVVDQDRSTPITYPVTVDFSHDATFPDGARFFLDDPDRQAVVKQAADDWANFFDGTGLDPVPAGQETTMVDDANGWANDAGTVNRPVMNAAAYTGFLLYATGVHTSEVRSTGSPGPCKTHQTRSGVPLQGSLCRSGVLEIEREGNFSQTGWFLSASPETWYLWDNLGGHGPSDLSSVVHHEIGHALFFQKRYVHFHRGAGTTGNGTGWGTLRSPEIRAYYPGDPNSRDASRSEQEDFPDGEPGDLPIDFRSHFARNVNSGAIDPASGFGAFGNEYADNGIMPRRRWIITKLDLLAAKALGYPLRMDMSPFQPLAITQAGVHLTVVMGSCTAGMEYTRTLTGSGGVPAYNWTVAAGALPAGLTLDSFTGVLHGIPTTKGSNGFVVRLQDSLGSSPVTVEVVLVVR